MSLMSLPPETFVKVHKVLRENVVAPTFKFLARCIRWNEEEFPDMPYQRQEVYFATLMAILQSLHRVSDDPRFTAAWETIKHDMMDGSPDSRCSIRMAVLEEDDTEYTASVDVDTPYGLIEMSFAMLKENPQHVTFTSAFPVENGDFLCEAKTVYFPQTKT